MGLGLPIVLLIVATVWAVVFINRNLEE